MPDTAISADPFHRLDPAPEEVRLFGPGDFEDFDPKRELHELVIVVPEAGAAALEAIAELRGKVSGTLPPLVMTSGELTAAADVFPLEILSMRAGRPLIEGGVISGISCDKADVRRQLERELRSRLFVLRQRLVAALHNPDDEKTIAGELVTGLARPVRGHYMMTGATLPNRRAEALQTLPGCPVPTLAAMMTSWLRDSWEGHDLTRDLETAADELTAWIRHVDGANA